MKEELITFETAKLAKQKGFNLSSYNWYRERDKSLYGTLGNRGGVEPPVVQSIGRYVAPTQSLLQRWLREKYNIHVEAGVTNLMDGLYCYEICMIGAEPVGETVNGYEKALEDGLYEALKLI